MEKKIIVGEITPTPNNVDPPLVVRVPANMLFWPRTIIHTIEILETI